MTNSKQMKSMKPHVVKVLSNRMEQLSTDDTEHLYTQRQAEILLDSLDDNAELIDIDGEGDDPSRFAAIRIGDKIYGCNGEIALEVTDYDC